MYHHLVFATKEDSSILWYRWFHCYFLIFTLLWLVIVYGPKNLCFFSTKMSFLKDLLSYLEFQILATFGVWFGSNFIFSILKSLLNLFMNSNNFLLIVLIIFRNNFFSAEYFFRISTIYVAKNKVERGEFLRTIYRTVKGVINEFLSIICSVLSVQ